MEKFWAKLLVVLLMLSTQISFAVPNSTKQLTVSSGTLFRVELTHRTRLQKGRAVQGRLLEAVYAENRLVIPSGAMLEGKITEVHPSSHGRRLDAKFHGDFTPLSDPVVEWTALSRNDGFEYRLQAESTAGAGSTLYFRSARAGHPSLFRRAWDGFVGRKNSALDTVKAPHKFERLERFFWSQMPYHPQYMEEGTQYEMALTRDLSLAADSPLAQMSLHEQNTLVHLVSVHSRLQSDISSEKAKAGDPVLATVTQPVLNEQNELIIPQNSILHGRVLSAVPPRKWGRNGILRFSFDELTWPSGFRQSVEGTASAIESSPDAKVEIDEEGGVARQTNRSIAAPLVMGLLSASALGDDDGGLGKAAVSSNGFALVGRLAAIGIGSRYVGGSIGAVGTGRAVYTRFLARGKDTHFGSNTEVLLEISPAHAHRMAPVQ